MAYLKFKNKAVFLEAVVRPSDNNVVRITTDAEPNISGFRLYLRENEDYPLDNGEYEAYTTLYRVGDGWYELSNDGSVYETPQPIEVHEPTKEELEALAKQEQKRQLQSEIDSLKKQIESTDYQIIKSYEYSLVGLETDYDITVLHNTRQMLRDRINELQTQYNAVEPIASHWDVTGSNC